MNEFNTQRLLKSIIIAILIVVIIRTTWIGDDIKITIRTVLNTLNGFGATFNTDERVQAYTHPLWFLLIVITTFLIQNVYIAIFFLSVVCTVTMMWLLIRDSEKLTDFLIPIILLFSKAFVDYLTSGLENPLTHLLLVWGILRLIKDIESENIGLRPMTLIILGSVYLSRPDSILLVLPLVFYSIFIYRNQFQFSLKFLISQLSWLILPAAIWTLFSLIYYGFPFPTTAYAKLSHGENSHTIALQGIYYFIDSLNRDPLTLLTIGFGIFIGWQKNGWYRWVSVGLLLHSVYLIYIGGDFMTGRFLTPSVVVSILLLANLLKDSIQQLIVSLPIIFIGLFSINMTLLADPSITDFKPDNNGLVDERIWYFHNESLVHSHRDLFKQPKWQKSKKQIRTVCGGLGQLGLSFGPSTHIIDPCGLTDPLLSRLPIHKDDVWRIGHFERQLPTGYIESIQENKNLILDAETANYYEVIRILTRDPVFNIDRLITVFKFNLGIIKKPNFVKYRNQVIPQTIGAVAVRALDVFDRQHFRGDFPDQIGIPFETTIEILLPTYLSIEKYEVEIIGEGEYSIDTYSGGWEFDTVGIVSSGHSVMEFPKKLLLISRVRRVRITSLDSQSNFNKRSKSELLMFRPLPK